MRKLSDLKMPDKSRLLLLRPRWNIRTRDLRGER